MQRSLALLAPLVFLASSIATPATAEDRIIARGYTLVRGNDAPQKEPWFRIVANDSVHSAPSDMPARRTETFFGQALASFQISEEAPVSIKFTTSELTLTTKNAQLLWNGQPTPKDPHIGHGSDYLITTGATFRQKYVDITPVQYLKPIRGDLFELKSPQPEQHAEIDILINGGDQGLYTLDLHAEVERLQTPEREEGFLHNLAWAMKPPAMTTKTVDDSAKITLKKDAWMGMTIPTGEDACYLLFLRVMRDDETIDNPPPSCNSVQEVDRGQDRFQVQRPALVRERN